MEDKLNQELQEAEAVESADKVGKTVKENDLENDLHNDVASSMIEELEIGKFL